MRPYKYILKHPLFIRFAAWVAAKYIVFVYRTSRWEKIGWENPQQFWSNDQPFICAFWHNRLLLGPYGWTHHRPFHMLISSHSDGKLISRTVEHHGIQTIPGSKNQGGFEALRKLLKILKSDGYIGITPDGPKGPRFTVSAGTINLARLSGCPIIPFTYSIKRRKVLSSWDRFMVALPFSKGVLIWGEPFYVSPKTRPGIGTDTNTQGDDLAEAQKGLETAMNKVMDQADTLCGHERMR